jgi:hypothetical protein
MNLHAVPGICCTTAPTSCVNARHQFCGATVIFPANLTAWIQSDPILVH